MSGFPATHRSVLERLRSEDAQVRHGAFSDLAEGYWRPSYHYLRLHWRLSPEEAEDIVQGFFTVAFEKGYLERFDPAQAKFRTFLRTCLDRFFQNSRKASRAQKRGGAVEVLSLDFPGAERDLARISTDLRDLDRFFRDELIRALFARTVLEMREIYDREGRSVVFQVFERHDLADMRADAVAATDVSYASVAADLGISATQVTNHLYAARRRFRELALQHLRALVATDEEFRLEARDVFGLEVAD